MSRLRSRILRSLGAGAATTDLHDLGRRLDELERGTQDELDRHDKTIRELATDLAERVAALEQRLSALEARSRDQ